MTRRSYTSKGREQNPDAPKPEFDLDGVTFVGDGNVSLMDLSEFARLANQGVDSDSQEGAAIMADVFLMLLGKRTYDQFRRHCREHGTDGDTLVKILGGLISEATDRPTVRPSDSSDGPQNAPDSVTVVSFSRGTVEQTEPPQEEETPRVVSYG